MKWDSERENLNECTIRFAGRETISFIYNIESEKKGKFFSIVGYFLQFLNGHKFPLCNIYYIRVYNSVAVSMLMVLCNYYHYEIMEHFHHPQNKPLTC